MLSLQLNVIYIRKTILNYKLGNETRTGAHTGPFSVGCPYRMLIQPDQILRKTNTKTLQKRTNLR